jgi:hypothetical protein
MAALNFPSSPTHLDTYTDPNQAVWQYDSDGTFWNVITSTTRKNFSGVRRTLSAGFDLTNSYQIVDFDTEDFSVDNYFQGTNTRITTPTTGFYRLQITVFTDTQGEGSSYSIQVRKNGTAIETSTAGPNQSISYDETLSLTQGDYIELYALENTSVGGLTSNTEIVMYRIGFAPGTGISNHNAFSGVRATVSSDINTTSTPTAVAFGTTDFNANANVNGDLYWFNSVADRLTVRTNGYYKIRSFVQSGTDGSNDSYTITVRKNGTTTIDTVNISANDFVDLDQVLYLNEDDYVELMVSNSDNTGSVLDTTYLELVREGV